MRASAAGRRRRISWLVLLLVLLALLELRPELQLLLDHFTWTSLREIPRHHPLALIVLLSSPLLWRRCP
jgi:hypothetical protein